MHDNSPQDLLECLSYWKRADKGRGPGNESIHPPRYLTCEIDAGGFNNIRQAFEYAVIIAALTERILVLPPPSGWYLINFGPMEREGEPGEVSRIEDFFDISDLRRYLPVVTANEFADAERQRLNIPEEFFGSDGASQVGDAGHRNEAGRRWNEWLQTNMRQIPWSPLNNVVFYPDIQSVLDGPCSPVASFMDGRIAVEFDATLSREIVLHLPCDHARGYRQLGQVSTAVAFDNPDGPGRLHELLKNGLHYVPEVFEIAARIIDLLGLYAYAALHIRRNDFQYKQVRISAGDIQSNIAALLQPDETLYVATDEPDPEFLAVLRSNRNVLTWQDVVDRISADVPPRLVACIEQVVCAGARIFIGTQFSTMSSYVVRLRGYMGAANTGTYYHNEDLQDELLCDHSIRPVSGREYMREDESLWRRGGNDNERFYSLICTDNHPNVHWQCELLENSWCSVRQPGELLRLVSANEPDDLPRHERAAVIRTRFTNVHPKTGDTYPPYNRLYSLRQWLQEHEPCGTVLILDPDYVFRAPVIGSVSPGSPRAQFWVDCAQWDGNSRFVKALSGISPVTAADMQRVTWPALIHTQDLERLMPRWIELTSEYRQRTGAWESDMVAFVVASAEIGLRYRLENIAAWMNWPEEQVRGAPIVHYCQKVEDRGGNCLWWKHDYQPWQSIDAMPQEARLDYCRDLLAIVKRYAAYRRRRDLARRDRPEWLDVTLHVRGRAPIIFQCGSREQALEFLCEAMESDPGKDETMFLELDGEERIQFTRSDLIALETAPKAEDDEPGNEEVDLIEVEVSVTELGAFTLFCEVESPAVVALQEAIAANDKGAPDEMMFMQTGERERVYFLRSSLVSVDVIGE